MKTYKTNRLLYMILLFVSILISISIFIFPMSSQCFTIVTGIGCGGVASVIIAWLLDAASCRANNQRSKGIRRRYFCNLRIQYSNLLVLLKNAFCNEEKNSGIKKSWIEWIAASPGEFELSDSNARMISQDIGLIINKINDIEEDELLIETLHILPEDEISALIHIRTDLQYIKHSLDHDKKRDREDMLHLFEKCNIDAGNSALLREINNYKFQQLNDFIEFIKTIED